MLHPILSRDITYTRVHTLTDLLDIPVRGAEVSGCRAAPEVSDIDASRVSLDSGLCVVIFSINYSLQAQDFAGTGL